MSTDLLPETVPNAAESTATDVKPSVVGESAQTAATATPTPTPSRSARAAPRAAAPRDTGAAWLADGLLIGLFLALAFLLGVFPLKDADFYWHLRTGDLIRQTGEIPRRDFFTFTREGVPWIDLHWIFQIAISWVHQRGGIVALNLAKCAITCVALGLLVTARKRDWPVWVILVAWLPALFVLSGRIYVRPETLTLLYLSIFLAVILRWDRRPRLVVLLPIAQLFWVNSHGLFVLGPVILTFGLIDAALRLGFRGTERRAWWRTILAGSLATCVACLINPYFITGALHPLELAGTMRNPIFAKHVAELMSIPEFVRTTGWWNLPLLLHVATIAVGGLSFLVPLAWRIGARLASETPTQTGIAQGHAATATAEATPRRRKRAKSRSGRVSLAPRGEAPPLPADSAGLWKISPFRFLLYAAMCLLSMQATRNSHQFAAVVGTLTAWNFGEWAAALKHRRGRSAAAHARAVPAGLRVATAAVLVLLLAWVGSGQFFKMTGEGRTIGLGEDPTFFPHQAARFAGGPGMPMRCLAFHNGNASIYEYYHGPERKVFTDPRLEVTGADLFRRYVELEKRIENDAPGWQAELDDMGRPVILVDHEYNWAIGASLLRSARWRCVWFDPIAAVFIHDSYAAVVRDHLVDFAARHFARSSTETKMEPADPRGLAVAAAAYRKFVLALSGAPGEVTQALGWLGLDAARQLLERQPDSPEAWKNIGEIELHAAPPYDPSPRYRAPFDPVLDLSVVRATYALGRAAELAPHDFMTLIELKTAFDQRLMNEQALSVIERLARLNPKNKLQSAYLADAGRARAEYAGKLGAAPTKSWKNLSDLDQIVTRQLAVGRVAGAARLLEEANPAAVLPWETADRLATLRLHLGQPAQARTHWLRATTTARKGLQAARVGTTYLIEGDIEAARKYYEQALATDPDLFEAAYCLAVLEQDVGLAQSAYQHATTALETVPNEAGRSAARQILSSVSRFARPAKVQGMKD